MGYYEDLQREMRYPSETGSSGRGPFSDFSANLTPEDREQAFVWMEYLWNKIDVLRRGMERLVAYFVTDITITGTNNVRKEDWLDLLRNSMNVMSTLKTVGIDYTVYGNSFTTVSLPFRRTLRCPRCSTTYRPANIPSLEYSLTDDGEFEGKCPNPDCEFQGKFKAKDRKMFKPGEANIIRWSPHQISLKHVWGTYQYKWDIPDEMRQRVKDGDQFFINNMPLPIVRAAKAGDDLILNSNLLKHLKYDALAGMYDGGWGVPPVLPSFGSIYFWQLLRKYQEVVAEDYMYPMRVLTPDMPLPTGPSEMTSGPFSGGKNVLQEMEAKLARMKQQLREDPTSWFTLPFPVREGTTGGHGVQMLQAPLLEQATTSLLNGIGIPVEFYQGNMRWKASPPAIRLLEKSWGHLPASLNSWLNWTVDLVAMGRGLTEVDANLKAPSMFDNPARDQLLLQLWQSGQISGETAMEPWNVDLEQELENQIIEKKQRQKMEEKFQIGQATDMPPIGLPSGGPGTAQMGGVAQQGNGMQGMVGMQDMGGEQSVSISQLRQKAEQYAQYFLSQPEWRRRSEMARLKKENPTLHAQVTALMEENRDSVDSQGAAMARQEAFGAV